MSAIPGNLETDRQPPMTVPLRHFFVALGFLLAGVAVGSANLVRAIPGLAEVAHVHLLLAGWVCITIMGAMTQFVPVWSGIALHSRRLANLQLWLVTAGLSGFALAFVAETLPALVGFGAVLLAGFWVFVYNVARTLRSLDQYDVTARHFAFALLWFLLVTAFGATLAVDLNTPVLRSLPVTHTGLLGAHVTLAVFGAVLTTIYGALYQLGTMFTQTDLHGIDTRLQTVEEWGHLAGVVLLAAGRLVDSAPVARLGGMLVLLAALAIATVLGRKLVEMQVEWTPMHSRYAVVVPALAAWAVLSLPAWWSDPTARTHLFGRPGVVHLLVLGVVGFVIFGTLYHIVPFIVWVHRYSDRLGFENVPMIDDLYSERLAAADFLLLLTGTAILVASDLTGTDARIGGLGGGLVAIGLIVFLTNMYLVIRDHSPHGLDRILLGSIAPRTDPAEAELRSNEQS
jgi:cbb3-type cytochrome oxidase subunit 1